MGRECLRLQKLIAWAGSSAIMLFLFANIKTTDAGVGYLYLIVALGCATAIIATTKNPQSFVAFRRSSFFLLAFLGYFVLKMVLDISDAGEIKAYSVGTSGGLIFALALGWLASLFVSSLFDRSRPTIGLAILVLFLLLASLALAVDTYQTHFASVRKDLFLIDVDIRRYQRPGNFLIMAVLLASFYQAYASRIDLSGSFMAKVVFSVNTLVYLAIVGLVLVTSQLIGSNMSFAVTLIVSGGTLVWMCRPPSAARQLAGMILRRGFNVGSAFRRSLPRFALVSAFLGSVLVAIVFLLFSFTNLEPEQFRIFGFSEGRIGGNSLASRMRILSDNFLTQFAYDPIFGHLKADDLTTGAGTYAHSLLSLFSHLGIIGAILFFAYLGRALVELRAGGQGAQAVYASVDFSIFRLIMMCIILAFCAIATFFTWMPLWFALALFCPSLVIRDPLIVTAGRQAAAGLRGA